MTISPEQILHERILQKDIMQDLKILLSEIQVTETKLEELLDKKDEIKIYDENDFELQMLSLDPDIMNFGNGYENFDEKIYNEDIRNEVDTYLSLLESLLIQFDYSLELLFHKANENYKIYFKSKIENIINELDGNFEAYSIVRQEFYDMREVSKDNPYKIILNTYLYYKDIVFRLYTNIKRHFGEPIKQAELVKVGLQLDISVFENLEKWEDSIEVKNQISIYDLIKE